MRCRCARAHAVGCTLCVLCLNCCPASLPGDSQLAPHILPAQPWQLHPPYSDPLSADCDRPSVPAAALAHAAGDRRARLPHAASHDWCARRSVSGPHDALALVRSAVLQCATRHVAAAPPNPTPGPSRAGTPPQLMAVPSHYFKVVLGEYSGGRRAAVGAFVMPNAAIDPEVPLASFAVPIGALEEVAGGWRRARGGGGGGGRRGAGGRGGGGPPPPPKGRLFRAESHSPLVPPPHAPASTPPRPCLVVSDPPSGQASVSSPAASPTPPLVSLSTLLSRRTASLAPLPPPQASASSLATCPTSAGRQWTKQRSWCRPSGRRSCAASSRGCSNSHRC